MTAMWEKLIILLNQTLELYQTLLLLSQRKRDVLKEAKPQELEVLTKQEEVLIIKAGKLETSRKTLMNELAAATGLPPNETTLKALIAHADQETAAKLTDISDKFAQLTGELDELNILNARLIQQSLDIINYSINILSQSAVGPTYAPKGQPPSATSSRSILDTKA
ncbi:MAG: FlgN protein [Sporomusa sp.]|jgi:flagellar biosynthesis/type III secretory pathway chaperone|nr:FlgN protein [Sporomusa sp.]